MRKYTPPKDKRDECDRIRRALKRRTTPPDPVLFACQHGLDLALLRFVLKDQCTHEND